MTSSGMLVEWAGVGEPQSLVCKSIGGLYADLSPEDFSGKNPQCYTGGNSSFKFGKLFLDFFRDHLKRKG